MESNLLFGGASVISAIAAIWLGEKLSSYVIIGGLLVLSSTIIITLVDYKMQKKTAEG